MARLIWPRASRREPDPARYQQRPDFVSRDPRVVGAPIEPPSDRVSVRNVAKRTKRKPRRPNGSEKTKSRYLQYMQQVEDKNREARERRKREVINRRNFEEYFGTPEYRQKLLQESQNTAKIVRSRREDLLATARKIFSNDSDLKNPFRFQLPKKSPRGS